MSPINSNTIDEAKISISFHRLKFSTITRDYLCSKLDGIEDEKIIRHIELLTSGQLKKLKAVDANCLVKKLLQVIIVDDEMDNTVTETTDDSEHESDEDMDTGKEVNDEGLNPTIIAGQSPSSPEKSKILAQLPNAGSAGTKKYQLVIKNSTHPKFLKS